MAGLSTLEVGEFLRFFSWPQELLFPQLRMVWSCWKMPFWGGTRREEEDAVCEHGCAYLCC